MGAFVDLYRMYLYAPIRIVFGDADPCAVKIAAIIEIENYGISVGDVRLSACAGIIDNYIAIQYAWNQHAFGEILGIV